LILQSLEELDTQLRNAEPQSVYLVLGPEEYLCRQAIDLLKSKILKPEALAFDYHEFIAGEAPVNEIIKAANTFPMISRRKVVLVTQVEKLKDAEQDRLVDSLKKNSPRSTLVLSAIDLDHRKRFYKALRDGHCVAEFQKLKIPALERWTNEYFKKQGYRVSTTAISKIVELAGSDLQSLVMELDKLILYSGTGKDIPNAAVDDLVRGSRQQSIFELIGAIGKRDRSGALRSLANLVGMGEHPLVVVAMMARHCRQVIIAQECLAEGVPAREIGSAAQIPPFMLDQFLRQARGTDPVSVREMFIRIADIDKKLKSTQADGRMLLESLICALV